MKWNHFLKLFDGTFFKMSLQFLAIIVAAFIVLFAVGYYEASGGGNSLPVATPDSIAN